MTAALKLLLPVLMFVIALSFPVPSGAEEALGAPSTNSCGDDLAQPSATTASVRELIAFLSFDHPIQKLYVERLKPDAIVYLLHWSTGFEFPSEPGRYHPGAEGYEIVFAPTTSWLGGTKLPWEPRTSEDYLRVRRSTDKFARYLLRQDWPANSLIQDADDMMALRYARFASIADAQAWRDLPLATREGHIDAILSGLLEGTTPFREHALTKHKFFVGPPAALSYELLWTNREQGEKLRNIITALSDETVAQQLKLFLLEYLPEVVARKNDFRFRSRPDAKDDGEKKMVIPESFNDETLADFRRYLLRDTATRKRLRHLADTFVAGPSKRVRNVRALGKLAAGARRIDPPIPRGNSLGKTEPLCAALNRRRGGEPRPGRYVPRSRGAPGGR